MNPRATQVAAVRLRNAVTNLLKEIDEPHDGWHLEPPPEEMTMSSVKTSGNVHVGKIFGVDYGGDMESIERDTKLAAARDAVIEAARKHMDSYAHGHELRTAVENLIALETPPDPLGPVREFVRIARLGCIGNGYLEKLEAAAKAFGMEVGK